MASLLLACATLTARALDRTFLEGNDVTVDKLTSLSALDFTYDDLDRLISYTGQGGTKYIAHLDNPPPAEDGNIKRV